MATLIVVIWGVTFVGPILMWLLFRNRGYKRRILDRPPQGHWIQTGERSVDLKTSDVIVVWYDPVSGERAYVRAPP